MKKDWQFTNPFLFLEYARYKMKSDQMKKYILPILLILIFNISAQSQSKVHLGVKGGYINSGFLGNDAVGLEKRAGYSVGVFFHTISKRGFFGIQPELLYAQKGASLISGNVKEDYLFHYAETPIMFKISIPIKIVHAKILLGPYAAFKVQENITQTDLVTNEVRKLVDDTSGFDFGMTGGAGIDLMLKSLFLTVDGRYNMGFTELGGINNASDVKNANFSVNVGVGIKI